MKKETQTQKVKKWFLENDNAQMYYQDLAHELNILVPNMRRILGQGTLKGIFTRVHKGIYKLNQNHDFEQEVKNCITDDINDLEVRQSEEQELYAENKGNTSISTNDLENILTKLINQVAEEDGYFNNK